MAARPVNRTPRGGAAAAALGVLTIIAHLLLAQLALVLTAAFRLTGRVPESFAGEVVELVVEEETRT